MLSTVRNHLQGLYEFHMLNPALVGLFWFGAFALSLLLTPQTMLGFLAPFLWVGGLSVISVYRLTRLQEKRMEQPGAAPWMVEVNGVHVGDLPDARVAFIQRDVAVDPGLYLQQLGNVARACLTAATSLVTVIPMMAFWLAIAMVLFEPDSAQQALVALSAASGQELRTALLHLGKVLGLVGLVSVGLVVTFKGNSLGLRNQFSAAFAERVRQATQCPAEGTVVLTQRGYLTGPASNA